MQRRKKLAAVVEGLELRRLLATITVTSTADTITPNDGAVTLREAITAINAGNDLGDPNITAQNPAGTNAFGTKDTIDFNIAGIGLQTISPTTQLPAITTAVTIDGYSQPGSSPAYTETFHGSPLNYQATFGVAIDGVNAGNASGLVVEAPNVTIDGLMIYRFTYTPPSSGTDAVSTDAVANDPYVVNGVGIELTTGSGNDTVWGDYLGTDGTQLLGNNVGVLIYHGSSNNTIGGTDIADRNVISGNTDEGVSIEYALGTGLQVSGNVVEGNYIGTNAAGQTAVANGFDGVYEFRSSNNTIGGTAAGAGNLISGNDLDGVDVEQGLQNTVQGNVIGLDVGGATALANGEHGVDIDGSNDLIGGTTAGARNVISGNGHDGIYTTDDQSDFQGNYIGTDVLGNIAVGNGQDGIYSAGGMSNLFGGTAAGAGNLISGNVDGISLVGESNSTVQGNTIGTDISGTIALGNTNAGILIEASASGNTVGGTVAGAGNLISGNGAYGIQIQGTSGSAEDTENNTVQGNVIGTDITGTNSLGDGSAGIYLNDGANDNLIGGTVAGARNVVSGIAGAGIWIDGNDNSDGSGETDFSGFNTIEGNYIGTDLTGKAAITYPPAPPSSGGSGGQGNYGDGIYISESAHDNTIGGTTAAARNIISGNQAIGVYIDTSTSNTVEGNYIGVDVTGQAALGNGDDGIYLSSYGVGTNNVIGGAAAGAGNVISANSGSGVQLDNTSYTLIQGNDIGVLADGVTAAGNTNDGVLLFGLVSNDNTIGGNISATANTIANNKRVGVEVASDGNASQSPLFNTIQRNSIYGNGELGIDLDNYLDDTLPQPGVTPNDPGDADQGGNDLQNFPVLVTATSTGSSVTVTGTFNSLAGTSFILDFYGNATVDTNGFSQGKQYLGSVGVITDANGNSKFKGTFNVAIGSNKYITATATNESTSPYGDTSEFSQAVEASAAGTGGGGTNPTPTETITAVGATFDATASSAFNGTVASFSDNASGLNAGDFSATINWGDGTTPTSGTVSPNGSGGYIVTGSHTYTTANSYTTTISVSDTTSSAGASPTGTANVTAAATTPPPPAPPTLSIGDVSMNEGNSGTTAFTFTITRSGDLSSASSVQFATADGTATVADKDYQPQSNTIGFDPNQATKTITILVNGDTKVESNETFFVNLSNATGATIADAQATGTIINDDASAPPPPSTGTVTVVTDPNDSTRTALNIVGTSNADTITVTESGSLQGKAVVKINGVNKGTFSFTGIILVYGNAGNDNISIDSAITRSAWIWGGDGNDTINGGGGTDMIFGQAGNDSINGNAGRDILIGGDGTDKLSGGSGDDVLIAGDFKSTPSMSQLASIQKEWTRTDKNYSSRVKDLTTGGGYNTIKLNSSTLFSSTTLKDSLTGGADSDLFFAAMTGDNITDKASSETAVNIG